MASKLVVGLVMLVGCARQAMICDPATNKCRDADGWSGLAPNDRFEHLLEKTGVEGIQVDGSPARATGWALTITNTTSEPITFAIADSTFTLSDGHDVSRLIRGETKRIDSFRAPAVAQIAPRATWTGVVIVSKLIQAEDLEQKARDAEERIQNESSTDRQKRDGAELEQLVENERAEVSRMIVGGTLSLALQHSNRTELWVGSVARDGRRSN